MEDSSVVQCEENKTLSEKNRGRQYKSKEQLQGLEDFYSEHKYPTESLKLEMAIKLNLTEKQVSGWFCHRRLKDKREALKGESQAPGRQDLSSGVIQDRGSGLKQDSCSSTKQADYKLAEPREVDSQRYRREILPVAELNDQQRGLGDGTAMNDTSSESNSAPQGSFYPQKRSHLGVETTEYRPSNGFTPHSRGRVGPSGYLKIKGQIENAAITAVKRQLGRYYREDGPSLGIEFDPLPPGAFESPSNTIDEDTYGATEPIGHSPQHISGPYKRPGFSTIRDESMYETPDNIHLHKPIPDNFSFRQPKQKLPFPNHSHGFSDGKSSFGIDSYSDYNGSRHPSMMCKQDLPGVRSDSRLERPHSYAGKIISDPTDTFLPDYDNVSPKAVHRREQFSSRPAAMASLYKDPIYKESRRLSNEDEGSYMGRRPTSEHNDSIKLKMHPTNELSANKRGREEFLEEDYSIGSPSQDPTLWSKQRKRPMEMPLNFSEDEAAETSSSMN